MNIYYRPQTKLRKGNVFTPICQSLCSHGGICLSACWDTHLRTDPWADTSPWADIPWADGHCSGQYASYWNAFLFKIVFSKSCRETDNTETLILQQ